MGNKSYRDLEIYQLAFKLAVEVHTFSLSLPKYELYEQGSQIRRASQSISNNIVEGYGRRRYKQDFIRFLVYAQSSCDETVHQIQMLIQTHDVELSQMLKDYIILGKSINRFIQYVEKDWK